MKLFAFFKKSPAPAPEPKSDPVVIETAPYRSMGSFDYVKLRVREWLMDGRVVITMEEVLELVKSAERFE